MEFGGMQKCIEHVSKLLHIAFCAVLSLPWRTMYFFCKCRQARSFREIGEGMPHLEQGVPLPGLGHDDTALLVLLWKGAAGKGLCALPRALAVGETELNEKKKIFIQVSVASYTGIIVYNNENSSNKIRPKALVKSLRMLSKQEQVNLCPLVDKKSGEPCTSSGRTVSSRRDQETSG